MDCEKCGVLDKKTKTWAILICFVFQIILITHKETDGCIYNFASYLFFSFYNLHLICQRMGNICVGKKLNYNQHQLTFSRGNTLAHLVAAIFFSFYDRIYSNKRRIWDRKLISASPQNKRRGLDTALIRGIPYR